MLGPRDAELLVVLEVDAVDRLAEGAVRLDAIGGDRAAEVVGDKGGVAGGVDRDVGRASSAGGNLANLVESAGAGILIEGGDRRCRIVHCIDRVEKALLSGARGRQRQEGWPGGRGDEDWRSELASRRIKAGLIDALADALAGVGPEVDEDGSAAAATFFFLSGNEAKLCVVAAKAGKSTRNLRRVNMGWTSRS